MIPAVSDASLKEACRLVLQQRGKARNSQLRAIVDSNFIFEATTATTKSGAAPRGSKISSDDTEAFLDWAIAVVEENIGDGKSYICPLSFCSFFSFPDVEVERLFTAVLALHLCNLRAKREDYHPQKIHVYLNVVLATDRAHRESHRSEDTTSDEDEEMADVLEPLRNCGLFWLILSDMIQSSSLPLCGLALQVASALFVHTRIAHIIEAWDLLVRDILLAAPGCCS